MFLRCFRWKLFIYEMRVRSSPNVLQRHNDLHELNLDSFLPLLLSYQGTGRSRERNEESVDIYL
jgi:hypothetical protein